VSISLHPCLRAALWQATVLPNKPHLVWGSLSASFSPLPFPTPQNKPGMQFLCYLHCNIFLFFFIFTVCIFPPPSFHRLPIANLIAHPSLQLVYVPYEVHFIMAF